jgi:hypothetical protein
MTDRVHDPALSEKGMREADGAARGVLAATGGTGRKPLVLVMHSDFIDFLLKALLAIPGDTRGYFANSNCSLTEVWLPRALCTSGEGAATLHYLNRIEHL